MTILKMPEIIDDIMFAPCGINCAVCNKHVEKRKKNEPCEGCLKSDGSAEYCRVCNIKSCARQKGHTYCFECAEIPCRFIKYLENSYVEHYNTSLLKNSEMAREMGVTAFLEYDRKRWTCEGCNGVITLQDGVCSECKKLARV